MPNTDLTPKSDTTILTVGRGSRCVYVCVCVEMGGSAGCQICPNRAGQIWFIVENMDFGTKLS